MFFRMLISNVYKSVFVINSTETRFSRNWLKRKEKDFKPDKTLLLVY